MPPLECSFRTISILLTGVLVLLATHFKAGLQLIGNDLASFSSINPTGASTNTDRVSHHTLCVCTDRYFFPTKHTDRVYLSLFFQTDTLATCNHLAKSYSHIPNPCAFDPYNHTNTCISTFLFEINPATNPNKTLYIHK